MVQRPEPHIIEASSPPSNPADSATIIFLHGLDDDAFGVSGVGDQFTAGNKLPHARWVFPNALQNMDAMATAWYMPTELSRIPSQRPELDDPEDEDGLKISRKYVESLIEDEVRRGVPLNRIVLGGFSQGHAMTLFTGLTSGKYAGKLGGLVCVCGYLPMAEQIEQLREESELAKDVGDVPIFIARGMKDMLVPKRYYEISSDKLSKLGYKDELIERHEYPNQGHTIDGPILRDLCVWLEKTIPQVES